MAINHFLDKFESQNEFTSRGSPWQNLGVNRGPAEGRGIVGLKFTDFVKTGAGLDGGLVLPNSARDPNGISQYDTCGLQYIC